MAIKLTFRAHIKYTNLKIITRSCTARESRDVYVLELYDGKSAIVYARVMLS